MTTHKLTQPALFRTAQKRDSLRLVSLLLVVAGVIIAGYLSYTGTIGKSPICAEGVQWIDCGAVQNSVYSKLAGIPVAYLGLGMYLLLGAILLLEDRLALLRDYGLILVFGLTLFGFIYSMYLVYVQAAILQAFCEWCLTHEAVMTVLFVVSTVRLVRSLRTN
ncbi:MAG TPA: vitamin K epoxide reductase family protein [Phototrophicaceae bacterium]|nr:vitamin K epoxide reductase family protein [Phototrophicaceae bacterium]